jgi:hypothetical protein
MIYEKSNEDDLPIDAELNNLQILQIVFIWSPVVF